MNTTSIHPIEKNKRVIIVDILRGWALLGVVLVNYFLFFYLGSPTKIPSDDVASHVLKMIITIIFTNKSRILLNVLFGYGFGVLMANLVAKSINPLPFFGRRMFWLLIFGLVNSCFYYGDILKDYALIGMMLLIFHRASAKATLFLATLTFLIFPASIVFLSGFSNGVKPPDLDLYRSSNIFNVIHYGLADSLKDFFALNKVFGLNMVVLGCFFFGRFLQQIKFFERLNENKKYVKRSFWIALVASFALGLTYFNHNKIGLEFFNYYNIEYWFEGCLMICISSAICWLYIAKKLKKFFHAIEIIGKMTLTNYLTQNFIGFLLFSGFGLGLLHKLPFYGYVLIAIGVYTGQVYFSKWWLSKYNYGPAEWLWRWLTYGTKLNIKKKTNI
jgi:uncharacterized protein